MAVSAKICGINSAEAMAAAVTGGAKFVGLVFYPPSPRYITPEKAATLVAAVPSEVIRVGLFVDIDDKSLEDILGRTCLDLLQFHGAESPDRVAAARDAFGLPVMKAVKIAGPEDIAFAERYLDRADWLLFDAKVPRTMTGALPGGNALSFDWQLLRGIDWPLPWMLSGGLDSANVGEAVQVSGARAVDVSSGVEARPGRKDPNRIASFLDAVSRL